MEDIAAKLRAWAFECPACEEVRKEGAAEIERLRDYACHKIGCAALHQMGAKCDCGLSELVGPREVSKP